MDDQAQMKIYGNPDLPEGTEERPLVTFALFAYNQEKYIREAVEGAFSQTYSPLEIILSDDCSSDRTFEIIQEIAEKYRGPHKVRAVRQINNLGTVDHVISISKISNGEYFVVNAGDDISYPNRVDEIINMFLKTRATIVKSRYDEIDSHGDLTAKNCTFPYSNHAQWLFRDSKIAHRRNGKIESAVGFAAAYKTSFWSILPPNNRKLLVEDGLATILANGTGQKIEIVNKSLIKYRLHTASLSLRQSKPTRADIIEREKKITFYGAEICKSIEYIEASVRLLGLTLEESVSIKLRKHHNYGYLVLNYWHRPLVDKFKMFLRARSGSEFKYLIARFLGLNFFIFSKLLYLKLSNLKSKYGAFKSC